MSARIRSALQRLARAALPEVPMHGLYEYRVVTSSSGGDFLDLQATVAGLPDLARVPARPGAGGSRTSPALGSMVLVGFINADPARPVVLAYQGHDGQGAKPDVAELDGAAVHLGAALGVVIRVGDTVQVGTASGPVALLSGLGVPPLPSRVKA